jgi:hypothetical protein
MSTMPGNRSIREGLSKSIALNNRYYSGIDGKPGAPASGSLDEESASWHPLDQVFPSYIFDGKLLVLAVTI